MKEKGMEVIPVRSGRILLYIVLLREFFLRPFWRNDSLEIARRYCVVCFY